MDLISVIIPVYNTEQYLERCLHSITHQTYTNLEIICINDGSTDSSEQILRSLAEQDARIKIITQSNKGASVARNLGLSQASGSFISFIDSDDYIDLDYYEKLLVYFSDDNISIVQTSMLTKQIIKQVEKKENTAFTFEKKIELIQNGSACDKIFRKKFLDNYSIRFLEGSIWEDNLFVIQALFFSQSFCSVNIVHYYYTRNENSTTRSWSREQKRKQDSLRIAKEIMLFLDSHGATLEERLSAIKFSVKNFIHKKNLQDAAYYQELCSIFENSEQILQAKLKGTKKRIFHLSLRKRKLIIFGKVIFGH